LKHISGQTPSPSAVPVRRQNKGFFLRVIDYGEIFRSLTKQPSAKVAHIHARGFPQKLDASCPLRQERLPLLPPYSPGYLLTFQPPDSNPSTAKHPLTTPKNQAGIHFLLRQTFPKDFTFFIGPADKLIAGNTEKPDWAWCG
jgi:hypothetical protein